MTAPEARPLVLQLSTAEANELNTFQKAADDVAEVPQRLGVEAHAFPALHPGVLLQGEPATDQRPDDELATPVLNRWLVVRHAAPLGSGTLVTTTWIVVPGPPQSAESDASSAGPVWQGQAVDPVVESTVMPTSGRPQPRLTMFLPAAAAGSADESIVPSFHDPLDGFASGSEWQLTYQVSELDSENKVIRGLHGEISRLLISMTAG
ncbi:hypothetical protein [Nocardia sp. NPDC049149]|uniref:hypothetical protein n=1 Tax=Nocardia sp. NPDC049149 TaxID=3364315 RepID=UPI0037127138